MRAQPPCIGGAYRPQRVGALATVVRFRVPIAPTTQAAKARPVAVLTPLNGVRTRPVDGLHGVTSTGRRIASSTRAFASGGSCQYDKP